MLALAIALRTLARPPIGYPHKKAYMLKMHAALPSLVVCLAVVIVSGQSQTLTLQDRTDAVRVGVKAKGKLTGLSLTDTTRAFANSLTRTANSYAETDGFSLRVYTPRTWVEQLASNAAKEYRPFVVADITEEMVEPMLRVIVYPDKPTMLVAGGTHRASSVEHVVLRDEDKRMVVQPTSKEAFTDMASSALRDMAYQGVVAKFPLSAVRELRGPRGDKEFLIVIVGERTREKVFKVKEKHFERLQ